MPPKKKGKAPAHQNRVAFRDYKHQAEYWQEVKSNPSPGLCARCHEQIQWKKQYHKYKPLSNPAKCVLCNHKTVRHAYHTVCLPCAKPKGICTKCQEPNITEGQEEGQGMTKQLEVDMKFMKERERRKVMRQIERTAAEKKARAKGLSAASEEEESGEEEEQEEEGIDVESAEEDEKPDAEVADVASEGSGEDVFAKAMALAEERLRSVQ